MKLKLGINTGFAVNRFSEHEEWARIVGEELGLKQVQLTADILSPSLPDGILKPQAKLVNELAESYGFGIENTFTGGFTRLNHLAHPYDAVRRHWVSWFKRFADLSHELGAFGMGSHFGILTVRQLKENAIREKAVEKNIECWHEIAKHAEKIGLEYLMWEPMSVKREYGETIESTENLHGRVNDGIAIPMKLCLDVDHGDVSSKNPDDTDPYAWLRKFGRETPSVHIKQSSHDKGGHWPFTEEKNKTGRIIPEKVISALKQGGAEETTLCLELSFREREPYESSIIGDIKESVQHWRKFVGD